MAKHRGFREFTGDELVNLTLGQTGFKLITNAEVTSGSTTGYEDIVFFVALKAVDVNAEVEAQTLAGAPGDDLTLDSGGDYSGSDPVTIENGDIIYGVFDKVKVASGDYIIAYVGKTR